METKVLPSAIEFEDAVLGAIMIEKNALNNVIDILTPESFYKEAHKHIYSSIRELFGKSEPVDVLTVIQQLRQDGKIEIVGGSSYVTNLTTRVNSAVNIVAHARIIEEMHVKRLLIGLSQDIAKDAFDCTKDAISLQSEIAKQMLEIAKSFGGQNGEEIQKVLPKYMTELEKKRQKDGLTGYSTGFAELDAKTGGLQKAQLTTIAARPAMGKSSFAIQLLINFALQGLKVPFFSLEMTNFQIMDKIVANVCNIAVNYLRDGEIQESDIEKIVIHTNNIIKSQIIIFDNPELTTTEIRAELAKMNGFDVAIFDYLQLIKGTKRNREQEINEICQTLRVSAKDHDAHVIALSQLNRAVENRIDKRPQLSDLRESGAIEQESANVIFLHRPEYYNITEFEDGTPTTGVAVGILAKCRSGVVGDFKMTFEGQYSRFGNFDPNFDPFKNIDISDYTNASFQNAPNDFEI